VSDADSGALLKLTNGDAAGIMADEKDDKCGGRDVKVDDDVTPDDTSDDDDDNEDDDDALIMTLAANGV
jgi:hypothetical protein